MTFQGGLWAISERKQNGRFKEQAENSSIDFLKEDSLTVCRQGERFKRKDDFDISNNGHTVYSFLYIYS